MPLGPSWGEATMSASVGVWETASPTLVGDLEGLRGGSARTRVPREDAGKMVEMTTGLECSRSS